MENWAQQWEGEPSEPEQNSHTPDNPTTNATPFQHPRLPGDINNNPPYQDRVDKRGIESSRPAWTTRCPEPDPWENWKTPATTTGVGLEKLHGEPHGSVQTESAEQPVVCSEQLHQNSARPPYDKVLDWLLNCTDETPAEKLQIPRSEHPLSEQVVHNLAQADCDDEVASVVAELADLFMYGDVKDKEVP